MVTPVEQEVFTTKTRALNEARKFNLVVDYGDPSHFVGYNNGTLRLYVFAKGRLYRFFHSDQSSFNEHLKMVMPTR